MYGKHHSKESKQKMSIWHKGKILSEEHKQKISKGLMGRMVSLETRQKLSNFQKEEHKRNPRFGEKASGWKGGKIKTIQGYVKTYSPNHHRASGGYVYEHILVWEKNHNRPLNKDFSIHHLNGIKDDNRPDNLIVMRNGEHIHQTEPFKQRIRELEEEIEQLKQRKVA